MLFRRGLAEQRREARDLLGQRGAHVLRLVLREGLHAGDNACEDDLAVDELAEACGSERQRAIARAACGRVSDPLCAPNPPPPLLTRYLSRSSRLDLCLAISKQLDKRGDKLLANNFGTDRLGELDKPLSQHVLYAPALVGPARDELVADVLLDGRLGLQAGRDRDEVGDGEQAHRVLVVGREALVQRDDLANEDRVGVGRGARVGRRRNDGSRKRPERLGRRAADHGRVVLAQLGKELAHLAPPRVLAAGPRVGWSVERCRRRARGEPVALRQPAEEREKVRLE